MLVVFLSLTGQTRKFVAKLGWPSFELTYENAFTQVDQPYIMIIPSYDREVTSLCNDFIETGHNRAFCKGVAGGGNRNFNTLFGFSAKDFSRDYQVPLLHLFEFQGSHNDVTKLKEQVEKNG
ncbi:class Ib ribonucleoside-diphosphate reductase assembly flavoprotein NrdI [Vaginisenegalia massiliensis]|uniref:class Ib ribonucleoside-diphosphate reductase assembly flavoprotein NrdI n=1 Tax=Vaginisenegalia massiliensis TaxID=2058294 RepID=UPI000F51C75C|nr:class Ib ribonucleoside-diphosphate reductase assembly flavoprotein NrdI [Vaginisenegalia massiliensis]